MRFKSGDKVKCVSKAGLYGYSMCNKLKIGNIYISKE